MYANETTGLTAAKAALDYGVMLTDEVMAIPGVAELVGKAMFTDTESERERCFRRVAELVEARVGIVEVVHVGTLTVDTRRRECLVGDELVRLTKKEWALLAALALDPERVWTKDELLHRVWGYCDTTAYRTLDSHASRLRTKLGSGFVINVWGVGYRLHIADRAQVAA